MSTSLLLVSDPGVPAALAQDLSSSLRETLADISASDREWLISAQEGTYRLTEQATFAEVMQGVDPANQPQDIVVYLTDLPRRDGTLPVVADISVPGRFFGVVSVACMGGLFIRRRVRDTVTGVVAEIEDQPDRPAHVGRLRRTEDEHSVRYTAPPPVRAAASTHWHGLCQSPVAVSGWPLACHDGNLRHWRGEFGVSHHLAALRDDGAVATKCDNVSRDGGDGGMADR